MHFENCIEYGIGDFNENECVRFYNLSIDGRTDAHLLVPYSISPEFGISNCPILVV